MKKLKKIFSFSMVLLLLFGANAISYAEANKTAPSTELQQLKEFQPVTVLKNFRTIELWLEDYFAAPGEITYSFVNVGDPTICDAQLEGKLLRFKFPPEGMVGQTIIQIKAQYNAEVLESSISVYVRDDIDPVSFYRNFNESDCGPLLVELNNNSMIGTEGIEYEWYVNDVNYSVYDFSETLNPGQYHVSLQAFNHYGDFLGEFNDEFFIKGVPQEIKTTVGNNACPNDEILFFVEADYEWLEWNFGNAKFRHSNYEKFKYLTPGEKEVKLTIKSECSNTPHVLTKTINVGNTAVPWVEFEIEGGDHKCPNDIIDLHAPIPYAEYSWDFGDGTPPSSEPKPIHAYSDPGTYAITLTAKNSCGNSNTDTKIVKIKTDLHPHANFDVWPDKACPGTPITFYTWESGRYSWDFGDGTVSEMKEDIVYYSEPGTYDIRLVIANGCGMLDTVKRPVIIKYDNTVPQPHVHIEFGGSMGDKECLHVCPGAAVKFNNHSGNDENIEYLWDFGDGITSYQHEPEHVFSNPGTYNVTMIAKNNCGSQNSQTLTVIADNNMKPVQEMQFAPAEICPGEKVYFFDNSWWTDFEAYKNTYSIDFGDGSSQADITEPTNETLGTLTEHIYTNVGTYEFTFTAENMCGNTQDFQAMIHVEDNAEKDPFYYVGNSLGFDNQDHEGEMPMWNESQNPLEEHHFTIPINWPTAPDFGAEGLNDMVMLAFWYGPVDFSSEPPDPNGVLLAQVGTTAEVYIPVEHTEVTMLAVWYCDMEQSEGEPDIMTHATKAGSEHKMFTLTPGATTDFSSTDFDLTLPTWDGTCNKDMPDGEWVFDNKNTNKHYYLGLNTDDGEYYMESGGTFNSNGSVTLNANSLFFTQTMGACGPNTAIYTYNRFGNELYLDKVQDDCFGRIALLTGHPFFNKNEEDNNGPRTGCPGDPVQFKIAGGSSYVWTFGDGSPSSSEQFPSHAYTETGTYQAKVSATNECGRTDIFEIPIEINTINIPEAFFWTSSDWVQTGDTLWVMWDQHDEYLGSDFFYSFGDGDTLIEPIGYHIYTEPGEYEISLTVTNGCGSQTEYRKVHVEERMADCMAKFKVDVNGTTVTMTNVSIGEATNFWWEVSGLGVVSDEENPTFTDVKPGIYDVCFSIYSEESDCYDQVCRPVQVGNKDCNAEFNVVVNPTTKKVILEDMSMGQITDWYWEFGNGDFSDLQNTEYQFTKAGKKEICLFILDKNSGCQSQKCKIVEVGTVDLLADFNFFIDKTTKMVKFKDISSGTPTKWYWTFGDGTMQESKEAEHEYNTPGEYNVCLFVTDENKGKTDKICKKILVGEAACNIQADFSMFVDPDNKKVVLTDESAGTPDAWFWNFGDGTTATKQKAEHIYTEPGFYLVTLSAINTATQCRDFTSKLVQIGATNCKADFDYKVDATSKTVTFENLSSESSTNYFWYFDDGTHSTEANPTHTFDKKGLYFVSLTVTDNAGTCMDFIVQKVQVGSVDCSAEFEVYVDSATNVAYFTNSSLGNATELFWSFGNGRFSLKENPKHQYQQPGFYHVALNTFDPVTGCMDKFEDVVLIGKKGNDCEADFVFKVDDTNKKVKFFNKSIGDNLTYIWNFDDNITSKETEPEHTYDQGGYYHVCLTAINDKDIPNTTCKVVKVIPELADDCFADFVYSVDTVTQKVTFEDLSYGDPTSLKWEFGDEQTSTDAKPINTYAKPGIYKIHLTIENASGCISEAIQLVNINKSDTGLVGQFNYKVNESNAKAGGYPVDFVGAAFGDPAKVEWDFGDGSTTETTSMTPTYTYTEAGEYQVCMTVSDPITGEESQSCQTVVVGGTDVRQVVSFANSLTTYPNPVNDYANVVYKIKSTTNVEIAVYDMLGHRIKTIINTSKPAGNYHFLYDVSNLKSGIYFIKMNTAEGTVTSKLTVK